MIVLLNGAQLNSILPRVSDLHREVLTDPDWRVSAGGRSHRHDLPAIAWRQILDAMLGQIYGPLGGKKAADAAYTACARIQQGLMRLEHHPALKGEAVLEVSPEVVPAWEVVLGAWGDESVAGSTWSHVTAAEMSAYPQEHHYFRLLRPITYTERGWRLTKWVIGEARRESESRTFDPAEHYRFIQPR